jgi:Protein of unknown function (DUF2004)
MKYTMPFFKDFDLAKLNDYYETEIEFEGRAIQIDLNFEDLQISVEKLDLIKQFLSNLNRWHEDNKAEIQKDYLAGKEVDYYIHEHLEQLDEEDLNEILSKKDRTKTIEQQMLDSFFLKRIGFYPKTENTGIVCDYTISEEFIDDLVVVFRKLDGTFDGIVIES